MDRKSSAGSAPPSETRPCNIPPSETPNQRDAGVAAGQAGPPHLARGTALAESVGHVRACTLTCHVGRERVPAEHLSGGQRLVGMHGVPAPLLF